MVRNSLKLPIWDIHADVNDFRLLMMELAEQKRPEYFESETSERKRNPSEKSPRGLLSLTVERHPSFIAYVRGRSEELFDFIFAWMKQMCTDGGRFFQAVCLRQHATGQRYRHKGDIEKRWRYSWGHALWNTPLKQALFLLVCFSRKYSIKGMNSVDRSNVAEIWDAVITSLRKRASLLRVSHSMLTWCTNDASVRA
jgi:hypothetical protein